MDITPFEIYLLMQMDSFKTLLEIALFISGVTTIISLVIKGLLISDGDDTVTVTKWVRGAGTVFAIILPLFALTPTTKTLVTMFAIPETLSILKSDRAVALGDKSLKGIEKLLDSFIEESSE